MPRHTTSSPTRSAYAVPAAATRTRHGCGARCRRGCSWACLPCARPRRWRRRRDDQEQPETTAWACTPAAGRAAALTLVAAAVCPHPPLLVPAVGAGADVELEELRRRCADAVATVTSADPDVVYVVGLDGPVRATSLAPWGVDVAVDVPEPLPLSVLA